MEKKDLIITVSGQVGSGKSRLTYLLKRFLKENGFDVEFKGGIDFPTESEFDRHMIKNITEVTDVLKKTRKITLKEVQLARVPVIKPRYFVDIRSGCGAVRDMMHKSYNESYPGLHSDTPDVVEYKHGHIENGTWNMKPEDVDYLNQLCNRLNSEA